jgi:hypothetical protein
MLTPIDRLYIVPDNVQTRWASPENPSADRGCAGQANAGRKGSAWFRLNAGEERILAEVSGTSGTVRRIWATISQRTPTLLRGLRLDVYWDGAKRPAVSAPLGDFFGTGLGMTAPFESALFASPEGRSFVCHVPMPFRKGMRMKVTNETDEDLESFYYDVNFTIGDAHPAEALYFHAHWRRENPTTLQRDFAFLPRVEGRGRFLGVNAGVICDRRLYHTSWWGEGEVKIYLDGDGDLPTLCGTGTEDYIGTGWGQGRFDQLYCGCHVADRERMRYCFYRYHVPDPVFFQKDIRVTIQQIGAWEPDLKKSLSETCKPLYAAGPGRKELDLSEEGGSEPFGLFERADDWSSCAYFYLDRPESGLPLLAAVGERLAGLSREPILDGDSATDMDLQ